MNEIHLSELCDSLRSISHSMEIHSRRLHKQAGVTAPQLSILLALAQESPSPLSKLSQKVHLSAATTSVTTAKLVANGLIAREQGAGDRRQVLLYLTDKGKNVLAVGHSPLPDSLIAHFNNGMPDWEKHMLLSALQKLAQMMQGRGANPV
jgi:DNA-binding MarR family transcriptional regulator